MRSVPPASSVAPGSAASAAQASSTDAGSVTAMTAQNRLPVVCLSTRRRERTVNTPPPWPTAALQAWHAHGVLLRGGTVIDVDGERVADVRIGHDGRIAANAATLEPGVGETEIDCRDRYVVP